MPQLSPGVPVNGNATPLPRRKVERVILAMRQHFGESFPLSSMADIAIQSRYHFIRTFHGITGITPRQFLGALRLDAAKRLLLTTDRNITDVCFDVGYNSLGTFTTRFTRLVGLNPRTLRKLAHTTEDRVLASFAAPGNGTFRAASPGPSVAGQVIAPDGFEGLVFVGAFPTPIPQGAPAACATTRGSGSFTIGPLREGTYYVMATAVANSGGPLRYLLCDQELRGRAGPVNVSAAKVSGSATIHMRPPLVTDPPILVALSNIVRRRVDVPRHAGDHGLHGRPR